MKLSAWFLLWVLPLPLVSSTFNRGSFQNVVGGASDFIRTKGPVLRRPRQSRDLRNCTKEDLERDPKQCCSHCPPGYHKLENCTGNLFRCTPCSDDTYTAIRNYRKDCIPCKTCDEKVSKVMVSACTRTSDVECGCKEGYARRNTSTDFSCMKDEKPKPEKNPPHTTAGPNPIVTPYANTDQLIIPMLLLSVAILVLGALIAPTFYIWTQRRGTPCCWCLQLYSKPPKSMYTTITMTPEAPNSTSPAEKSCVRHSDPVPAVSSCAETSQQPEEKKACKMLTLPPRPQHTQHSRLVNAVDVNSLRLKMQRQDSQSERFPPPVLYAIIREVPVRRWKEFLRLLHVPDGQMERVEFEAGPTYLERQYQMLRLWSQRGGSELAEIYAALDSMELSGCAQELRDKLEQLEKVDPRAQTLDIESLD
ncbi:tumor necrosis factor receptor superfamily member 25 [Scleropages formosus]|uniref:Tumor necrosis factor receptor superfamily member 25-like n=1 Tax=Scleropages formosus TaxID=113540 RepID=A0A8C9RJ03_SCLFO|nr:tumor necrosis factor receptor superfamily member 25-like [Scleropages formosus]